MARLEFVLTLLLALAVPAATAGHAPLVAARAVAPVANGSWPVYHRDDGHTGFDPSLAAANGAVAGWTAGLDGQVYGEPLVHNGLVFAVTLNNTVYAIDQAAGTVVWSRHLATPQSSGWICGLNVVPQGIVGTPVIDVAAGRIYVTALYGTDQLYRVVGLDLATGVPALTTVIPNTIGGSFDWKIQQQRGALALRSGYVYVPFGGRAGDCFDNGTPYYGWVVAVPTDGVSALHFFKTPSGGSGSWAAGGVVIDDATGGVIFATGNAIPCQNAVMSDSIVRANPTLTSSTYFQPADWQANWCGPDSDLGSASPVLINPNLMFTAGKHGGGFLLNPNGLTGANSQLYPPRIGYQQADVCLGNHGGATFGSFAYAAPYVYLQCEGHGIVALTVNTVTPSFSTCGATCAAQSWHAADGASFGPPIVAGGVVWAVDINGSGLSGFDAATGSRVFQSGGFGVNHFVTPSEAGGRILVPAGTQVRSFVMQFGGENLGGILTSGPDAASWAANRLDVFGRGTDNSLYHKWQAASAWSSWESLGGGLTSDPGAVSWGLNRIDVFARGTDSQLWHRWWTGTSWGGWEPLGGILNSGPDVASWSANRLDVFMRGPDNSLWHKWWDGLRWNPWESLGGGLTSDPGAVSWGPNRLDVFARGTDQQLWRRAWTGTQWLPWEPLGGVLNSGPDPSSCASGHLDVLAIGTDGALWRKGWNGTGWTVWQSLGGQSSSDPSAVCQAGATAADAFTTATYGGLWHQTFTAS